MIAAIFYMSHIKQNLQTKRFTARLYAKFHIKGIDWRIWKTKEEIDEIKRKQIQWHKKWTKKKLQDHYKRCVKTRLSWSEDKKREWGQKQSQRMLSWSEDKKRAIAKKKRDAYFSKSEEERKRMAEKNKNFGKANGMYGVHRQGKDVPVFGRKVMIRGNEKRYVKPEQFNEFLANGYVFSDKSFVYNPT